MSNLILQIWGGIFYLLNKILFSCVERSDSPAMKRRLRIISWSVYLAGLPPWVIIFILERNWIAAALETGGAPAMAIGLLIAIRGHGSVPSWLDRIAQIVITLGIGYSLYDFGGFTTVNQGLELLLVIGFLVGTYRLAKHHGDGYLWYMLMHVACGMLMWIQGYPWLFWQQIVSLLFIVDAFTQSRKR